MLKKRSKGGGALDLGIDFLYYIIEVIASVFVTFGGVLNENSLQFLYHTLFLGAYALCFYFLQFTTTQIPCIVLLLILHCIFLFMLLVIKVKLPILEQNQTWSFGSFSIYMVSVGWIFILIALAFLLKTYTFLYKQFIPNGVDIQFGTSEPTRILLIKTLIYAVIFMWIFYTLEYLKTNDVLLLNVFFAVFALLMLLYAIVSFVQLHIVKGSLSVVLSFLSMAMVKYIQDSAVDFQHFFTRNTFANSLVLLLGVIFNVIAINAYYLSSSIATTMRSIQLPQIIQLNPSYNENFDSGDIIQENNKSYRVDLTNPMCYIKGRTNSYNFCEISNGYNCCTEVTPSPTSTPTPSAPPPPSTTDCAMELWRNRGDPTQRVPDWNEIKNSCNSVPSYFLTPKPTPTLTSTPTPKTTSFQTNTPQKSPKATYSPSDIMNMISNIVVNKLATISTQDPNADVKSPR